jgi:glycosyltransferase involved in cell wall biosynthesis
LTGGDRRLHVVLACSGLDHASRGFESFARECFDALRDEPGLRLELVKGSGPPGPNERAIASLTRDSRVARALGRRTGRDPFHFEHFAFALSLQPLLLRRRPDVVYFSEWYTGKGLALLRRLTRARFRTLLSNGSMIASGFDHLDYVQQLTPIALETVIDRGADPARQTMLPLPAPIPAERPRLSEADRHALRDRLGLPQDRPVLLSVAALNRYHKRLDYLLEEIARLPEPRPFVLMAGQVEAETPGIRALAHELLGEAGHSIRTVPYSEVADLYRASDAKVLTSLGEALGRVMIEAMDHGLPCFVHDYPVTRFVLGEHGRFADFSAPGALAGLLAEHGGPALRDDAGADTRHRFAYDNFSWEVLRPRYLDMLSWAGRANNTVSSSSGENVSR